jgi:hypothetical protein
MCGATECRLCRILPMIEQVASLAWIRIAGIVMLLCALGFALTLSDLF